MGGGICATDYSGVNIVNCTISDNSAKNYGGAIGSCANISNSIIWGNTAERKSNLYGTM